MTESTTKTIHHTAPSDSQTDAEFVSEDVYAETNGAFTRVTCHDVYAFSSIATSGDYSETVDSVGPMIQVGVEIEFPNGRREILVFQPRNLLYRDPTNRDELLESLFNNGEVWIGEYESIFTPAGFPQTWDTMVVPDSLSVDSIFAYRDNSLFPYSPDSKEEVAAMGGGLSIVLLGAIGGFIAGGMTNSFLFTLLPMAVSVGLVYALGDSLTDKFRERVALNEPHLRMQRMDISESELNSCEPASEETIADIRTALLGLNKKWTESTVTNVNESPKTTELELLTERGQEISVEYPTPADSSDRFTLNRLTHETGVGSVQLLEGEQVEVSLVSLGKSDDIAKDGFYRVRPKK